MMNRFLLLLGLAGCSQAFLESLWGGPSWDGLGVTWGINPLGWAFNQMPRTESDAIYYGWTKNGDCSDSAFYRGKRYIKDNDPGVMLLFDVNGYIAGIQGGIPLDIYPSHLNLTYGKVINVDTATNLMVETAYFVPPQEICSSGRTQDRFDNEGTGSNLYLQQGPDPVKDSVIIPRLEADIGNTKWRKGRCFRTMGQHYWYDYSENMSCDDFYPAFLLYNAGELNAFGWALNLYHESPRYEHPTPDILDSFFNPVPVCLTQQPKMSTIHIYMDDAPLLNMC
ncbi:uncharacterized protein LOC135503070 [Lineus longissimus]|uniref:uncharacterized protein LOC135503070 n=1 Tax=Lineus longissimus TaxID=88925 RepID=UPI002B4E5D1B